MSKQSSKSNKNRVYKPLFMLGLLSFAAIVGLGFFRFNAAQLEIRLNSLERSIESYTVEEVELKQSLASLKSPIKIYSYCKDRLGMYVAKQESLLLPNYIVAETAAPEPQKGWRASMLTFFGLNVN